MQYKAVEQFKWLLIIMLLWLIYLTNLICIKLPFARIDFASVSIEYQIYSFQTIVVWSCGALLGSRLAFLTLCIYLLFGFFGFPVFAGGGGLDYYKEPTFGYLISLPLNAFLSGLFFEQGKGKQFLSVFVPMITTHLFGILYLLIFNIDWFSISWHLSFSMIGYDLIFSFLLLPFMPILAFVLTEILLQEVPAVEFGRNSAFDRYKTKTKIKNHETYR